MMNLILSAYARDMEQYFQSFFHQPEGLVEIGEIGGEGEEKPCKLVISLLNVEKESSSGLPLNKYTSSINGIIGASYPSLYVNMDVVMAAVFTPKRYKESLSFLSLAITFIQTKPVFHTNEGGKYNIEMISPSWQDQSNIWTLMGGHYYPSILCKIRGLEFNSGEMKETIASIKKYETKM